MNYTGRDRRVHQVFITRNTEYHVRRRRCVGVKDRRSGDWMRGHLAVDSEVSGGLRFLASGAITPTEDMPAIGESLFFCAKGRDLVTSPVVSIERPQRATVDVYDH